MIPDIYFEDPYPINIPVEDLIDCYQSVNPSFNHNHFLSIVHSIDPTTMMTFYKEMVNKYMQENFPHGHYATINDSYRFVDKVEEGDSSDIDQSEYDELDLEEEKEMQQLEEDLKKTGKEVFELFNIDISHLTGMFRTDLQVLAIPFNKINTMTSFGDKMSPECIGYWSEGQNIGNNLTW